MTMPLFLNPNCASEVYNRAPEGSMGVSPLAGIATLPQARLVAGKFPRNSPIIT